MFALKQWKTLIHKITVQYNSKSNVVRLTFIFKNPDYFLISISRAISFIQDFFLKAHLKSVDIEMLVVGWWRHFNLWLGIRLITKSWSAYDRLILYMCMYMYKTNKINRIPVILSKRPKNWSHLLLDHKQRAVKGLNVQPLIGNGEVSI